MSESVTILETIFEELLEPWNMDLFRKFRKNIKTFISF